MVVFPDCRMVTVDRINRKATPGPDSLRQIAQTQTVEYWRVHLALSLPPPTQFLK